MSSSSFSTTVAMLLTCVQSSISGRNRTECVGIQLVQRIRLNSSIWTGSDATGGHRKRRFHNYFLKAGVEKTTFNRFSFSPEEFLIYSLQATRTHPRKNPDECANVSKRRFVGGPEDEIADCAW